MKYLFLLLFPILVLGWSKTPKQGYTLNGTWIPTRQEMSGKELPPGAFEKYKLTMADSVYTYGRPDIDQGIVTYDQGKMDIYGRQGVNNGKHFTAIYKLENERLTICYNLNGDGYPESFETRSKPKLFLSVYKRE